MESPILKISDFNFFYGDVQVLKSINLTIYKNKVTSILGPSGCGKTTLIRAINRMHELNSTARVEGSIFLDGEDLYQINPILVRKKIGMVFQSPNPFPTMSIYENVIAGYLLNGTRLSKKEKDRIVEDSLVKSALWAEVKGNLYKKGTFLSGGQQQRLCIARALAMNPEILLLDEPTSALDPLATTHIEELLIELKEYVTLILVTHNISQAARISDYTAFFYLGELIEYDKTRTIFTKPAHKQTEEYLTGRYG